MSSTRQIIPCTKTVSVPCGWEKNLRNAKLNMPCYRIAFITSELQTQKPQEITTFLLLPEFLSHKRRITEHLKLPQVSTKRGQTTQFTDFYCNLDITTADYSSTLVVTTTPVIFGCILYLQSFSDTWQGRGLRCSHLNFFIQD